jgi:hypothetical protein
VKRVTLAAPTGEAGQIRSANKKFLQIYFYSLHVAHWRSTIAGPIVLVQHKGKNRIGEAQTPIHRASPIAIEISF